MKNPTNAEIEGLLINILSDGFNRSLSELRSVGVIDQKKLNEKYKGVESEYYDRVTAQIELTARWAAPAIRDLFLDES
jgi:flagellar basal body rod protein FlgF